MFYDAKFGRQRLPESQNGHSADRSVASNGSSPAVVANGIAHVKTSDFSIYEQFNLGRSSAQSNGALSNGNGHKSQKSLLPAFDSAETRSLAESLCRDIVRDSQDVTWENIKGLENAKRLLKEAVVMPIKYPK